MTEGNESVLLRAFPTETQAVHHDMFDVSTFTEMKESTTKLDETEATGSAELETFPPLVQDVFSSLYKYSPKVRDAGELKASHRFNHGMVNKAMETEQYAQLRHYTKLDPVNSALATVTIANSLVDTIKTELKEEAERANQLAQQENVCQSAMSAADSLQDIANRAAGTPQAAGMQKKARSAQAKAQKARQKLEKMQDEYDRSAAGSQQKIRQAIRRAEQDAIREVEETSELMESWGTEPGQLQQMSPELRLELAQRLSANSKLKRLARMLGRFRRLAIHAQKTRITHGMDEVYDVETGNDIPRVVPAELANLRNPLTKKDFYRRFTEGNLLQYKLRGMEKAGKGPIVCCVDSSGSMSGDREVWSKAVALSLLEIAQMNKRDFCVIFFGSESDPLKKITVGKGEKNVISKVVEIAEYFLNGGTGFMKPLECAMQTIEEDRFKKADIVFVTDGECGVADEWLAGFMERKEKKQVRIHSVQCGYGGYSEVLSGFSDQITRIEDLNADEAVEIFKGV